MKVLFSDYDGTIKTFDTYPTFFERRTFKKNIDAIDKFLGDGNKFVITTGRNTDYILEDLNKYGINYSYLTTYNGRITLNDKNEMIIKKHIHKELLKQLKEILENSNLITKTKAFNDNGFTEELTNLIILFLYSNKIDKLYELIKDITKQYSDIKIEPNLFLKRIKINIDYTKKDGAKELVDLFNWDENDIYAVGDARNDYELLKMYKGYKMLLSDPYLYFDIPGTTPSLHKLIKKINNI